MSDFEIGATLGGMVDIVNAGSFGLQAIVPVPFFRPWVATSDLGNGLARAQGRPTASWLFPWIPVDQRDGLKALCTGKSARVFITTQKVKCGDEFATYEAAMLWPDDESQIGGPDFVIEFRDLIEQI
jgi:hypothetical protein